MKSSEQINELAAALAIAQGEIKNVVAETENPFFKSTYADLASVRNAIQAPLCKNGLSVVQLPVTIDGQPALTTRLMHKSGQWLEDSVTLMVDKPSMQGLGSAITYAKRYCLTALLGLAEADDDGQRAEAHPAKNVGKPRAVTATNHGVAPECKLCLTVMKRTKKNDGWFCPNFQDRTNGEHEYYKDKPLENASAASKTAPGGATSAQSTSALIGTNIDEPGSFAEFGAGK